MEFVTSRHLINKTDSKQPLSCLNEDKQSNLKRFLLFDHGNHSFDALDLRVKANVYQGYHHCQVTHLLPFILTITMGSTVLFPRTLAICFLGVNN